MPISNSNEIIVFGETNFRSKRERFGIKKDDRRRHMYIIGKTGMGKTELLKNMIVQDIQEGRGIAFVDPHGDTADALLDYVPQERVHDVIYFNPGDLSHPIAFNVLEKVSAEYRHLVASGLMSVFKKIWIDAWSGRMEYILNNTILALLEVEGSTLLGVNRMFADKEYRGRIVNQVTDPIVKAFWTDEFARYTDRLAVEATASIQNKVGQFTTSSLIRNIIGQQKTAFDIREAMDQGKIIILNLARGRIGEDASRLLGALFITKIQLAAMSRVDIPESERRDFYLYVDEFQHFATESFANILSEARKFGLNLVIAHQYIAQMEEKVRDAVFGNIGTLVTFRVGAEDAEVLEKEFAPEFMASDIINLPKYQIYLKLMIDGVASNAFSASTLPPLPMLDQSMRDQILLWSRSQYATPRQEVENRITEWSKKAITNADSMQTLRGEGKEERRGREYRQEKMPHQTQPRNPSTVQTLQPVSLQSALRQSPVDFKGKPLPPKHKESLKQDEQSSRVANKPIDIKGLRNILDEAIGQKKEG